MSTRAYVGAGQGPAHLEHRTDRRRSHVTRAPGPRASSASRTARAGLRLERGQLAALVTETPDEAAVQVDRLGRFVADDATASASTARRSTRSRSPTCGRHVVVSEIEPRLFSGELRYELMPHGLIDDERIMHVLRGDELARRPRRARGRSRRPRRGARPGLLGRPAPAPEPGARHPHGRRGPGPRRADVGGRHAHRRSHRAATARGARDAHDARRDHEPAAARADGRGLLRVDGRVVDQGTTTSCVARSSRYRQVVLREDT